MLYVPNGSINLRFKALVISFSLAVLVVASSQADAPDCTAVYDAFDPGPDPLTRIFNPQNNTWTISSTVTYDWHCTDGSESCSICFVSELVGFGGAEHLRNAASCGEKSSTIVIFGAHNLVPNTTYTLKNGYTVDQNDCTKGVNYNYNIIIETDPIP